MSHDINLEHMRHSCAHVLAQAVLQMFPEAKLGIGPTIENGFYYDFDLPRTLIPEDLAILEAKMKKIVKQDQKFVVRKEPADKAIEFLKKINQPYKIDLVEQFKAEGAHEVSFYENVTPDDKPMFVDLCRGGHVESTSQIGAFTLNKIAGAYWRGDEKNPMLQRIYGLCFVTQEELNAFVKQQEEAKRRDHRKLGKELELFMIDPEVGGGLPLWMPKGAIIRDILQDFLKKEQVRRGYLQVITPHIGKIDLYKTSGHWQNYRACMYSPITIDNEEFILKPMNCPHHVMIYKANQRSYRDLPLRLAEFGTVYRYEQSGELSGLTRVRGFTQDDAHLFVRPDQVKQEFLNVLDLTMFVLKEKLGFNDYRVRIGVRDAQSDKYVGNDELWSRAEKEIEEAVQEVGLVYSKEAGDAAFYGPKLDFMVRDVISREWQLGTIQIDYNLPERFQLEFIGEDSKPHRPVMIHRTPFGSLERFIGILIEHYAGAFPSWLAPEQVRIIPVSDNHIKYASQVLGTFQKHDIRASIDQASESVGKKIRAAELEKIPYMVVVGDKEKLSKTVTVRVRGEKEQHVEKIVDFVKRLVRETKDEPVR